MATRRQKFRAARRHKILRALAQPWLLTAAAFDALRAGSAGTLVRSGSDSLRAQRFGNVALLHVCGVLVAKEADCWGWGGEVSYEAIGEEFRRLVADPAIQTIVLAVDSPGGMASGCPELSDEIYAARNTKTLIGFTDSEACSGGYWLLSSCKTIVASPSAYTGSIGVYRVHAEDSKLMQEIGIKETVIYAGQHKVDGNSYEPLSDQGRKTWQEAVDSIYTAFSSAVARNRGAASDAVRAGYGQGKALRSPEAQAAGLIDRIATLQTVLSELGVSLSPAAPTAGRGSSYPVSQTSNGVPHMDPKLRAALLARGLISAVTTDEQALSVLAAWKVAHNVAADATVETTIAALTPAPAPKPAKKPKVEMPAEDDGEEEISEEEEPKPSAKSGGQKLDRAAIVKAERERVQELRVRGSLIGCSAEQIDAAIDGGLSIEAALKSWTDRAAADERPAPRSIAGGQASADKVASQALDALVCRLPERAGSKLKRPDVSANSFARMSLAQIAEQSLRVAGVRCEGMTSEEIATLALGQGGEVFLRGQMYGGSRTLISSGGPIGRPSDFPNLLSALVGKVLDQAQELSPATYRDWCKQLQSVPDFKPKTINRIGEMGEFDYLPDNEAAEEAKPSEEVAWISADRYAKKFGVTPRMIADDDLGGLNDGAQALMDGHELTINRLAFNLLTGNPTLPDGVALFDTATHKNKIAGGSGGAPSQTQFTAVRKLFRAQKGVSGLNSLNLAMAHILVGEAQESAVEQTLVNNAQVVPITDATINTFRGRVTWSVDPMLTDWDSTGANWFAFADKARCAALVYVYQTGYEGGRVRVYYDQNTQTRWVECEGRFGVAINNYRGAVWNVGS